jgi:glucokinase
MAAQRTIGIDVGGTKILAGVVERDGTVLRTERRDTPTESTEAFLTGLAEVVDALRDDSVAAVGIGIPSTIDQRQGTAIFSVHVPLAGVPLRERGEQYLGVPVVIDNDANAAAVAEWTVGAGRGTQHMVMLTLGTGIGGGLILGGRLYRGTAGAAAELGHMVIEFDGPECRGFCTGRGHFEAFVSGSAATDIARELLGEEADSKQLVAAARGGD